MAVKLRLDLGQLDSTCELGSRSRANTVGQWKERQIMQDDLALPLRIGQRLDSPRRWFVPRERPWLYDQRVPPEPSEESVHYRYTPLADGEIRVLYIELTQDFRAPIRCTLKHGPIHWTEEFDPYITLSYCWGATKDDGSHLEKLIRCDGKLVRVTSNLETALRYIRHRQDTITRDLFAEPRHNLPVPIWIDAICIDQANTAERTQQVKQMAEIYSNSSRLVVWLGVPTGEVTPWGQELRADVQRDELERAGILKSPWFSRRWVIEEYGLTPIHSRFFLFGTSWLACFEIHRVFWARLDRLQGALAKYDSFGYDPSKSLLYNLYRFDGAVCSNRHDLVYSLLPLSFGSPEVKSIEIDYSQRIEDLFLDVARSIVQAKDVRIERLGPLLAVASAKRSGETSGQLPSWVPDWRVASEYVLEEHRQAVEHTLDRLEYERYGDSFNFPHNGVAIQWRERNLVEGLTAVERQSLLIRGRFLKPCFPPAHRRVPHGELVFHDPRAGNLSTEYCGPQGDQGCWTCRLFENWEILTPVEQDALEAIDENTQALFMIPRSALIFILNRRQSLASEVFTLAYCIRSHDYAERDMGNTRTRQDMGMREELFQVLDHVTLV